MKQTPKNDLRLSFLLAPCQYDRLKAELHRRSEQRGYPMTISELLREIITEVCR